MGVALFAPWPVSAGAVEPTVLYLLKIDGIDEELTVAAGDEPVRVARQLCMKHGISASGCAQVMDHLCGGGLPLRCRSEASVFGDGDGDGDGGGDGGAFVGSAQAAWGDCALRVRLSAGDARRALVVDGRLLESLVSLHCANLAAFRPDCACSGHVRDALNVALSGEIERYRWSEGSDHYATLALDVNATQDDVKKAYRRWLMLLHPDRSRSRDGLEDAGERVMQLNEANAVLSDGEARLRYDQSRFGIAQSSGWVLPRFKSEVTAHFGRAAAVSVDASGNIKIVL